MRVKAGIAERAIAGQVAVGVEGFREWLLTPYPAIAGQVAVGVEGLREWLLTPYPAPLSGPDGDELERRGCRLLFTSFVARINGC
jgi:hypothetical protein